MGLNAASFGGFKVYKSFNFQWMVLGIRNGEEHILTKDLPSEELADAWLRVYLEMYVRDAMFPRYMDC